jgi:hypothetical protein
MAITTRQNLLTDSWTADVAILKAAVRNFEPEGAQNDCQVAFFEIVQDRNLHVNVTHKDQTKTVRGWAGPGSVPEGFVHNRTFGDTQPSQIIRQLRKMVCASRPRAS